MKAAIAENLKHTIQVFRRSARPAPRAKPILRPVEIREGTFYLGEPSPCRVRIAARIGPSEPSRDPTKPLYLKAY